MAKTKKVPEIRFKGFKEEWEENKLIDISTKINEKNTGREYSETFTNSAEHGIVSQRDYFDHDIANAVTICGYYIVRNDDFVYNPRISSLAPVGPISRNKLGRTGIVSPLYLAFRIFSISPAFLEYYFKSNNWHSFMRDNGDSGARSDRLSIKTSTFFLLPLCCPKREEQVKVEKLLTNLDALIALHQRKHDKLLAVKNSMLEKMFPKEGADVPEIRFNGFTGKWAKEGHSKLFIYLSNNTFSRAEMNHSSGTIRNIHYGDVLIKFGETIDTGNDILPFITDATSVDKLKSDVLRNGDVVIADTAEDETVGKCSEITNVNGMTIVSGLHTIPCRPSKPFASGYLGYFMNSTAYHDQLMRLMQGTKVLSISKAALQDTNIYFPEKNEEQAKIATFFQRLDSLITLHQQELDKLKNIKKACLEKMFV